MKLFVRRDGDAHSPGELIRAEIVRPFPAQDVDADRTDGADPQTAAGEVGGRTDVAAFEIVPANRFANSYVQLFLRIDNLDLISFGPTVELIGVLIHPGASRTFNRFVTANPFENARAVMKPEGR